MADDFPARLPSRRHCGHITPLATASGRCDVSGTPGAWVVALTSGVRVAALPSYGGVLSYIIHHAFFCRAVGSAGKSTVGQR